MVGKPARVRWGAQMTWHRVSWFYFSSYDMSTRGYGLICSIKFYQDSPLILEIHGFSDMFNINRASIFTMLSVLSHLKHSFLYRCINLYCYDIPGYNTLFATHRSIHDGLMHFSAYVCLRWAPLCVLPALPQWKSMTHDLGLWVMLWSSVN